MKTRIFWSILGRSHWRFDRSLKSLQHDQQNSPHEAKVALDISRMYILVFQWVKGESAWALCNKELLSENEMWDITLRVKNDLADVSFRVLDHKPQHIILRWRKGGFLSHGALPAYALVDFELLEFRPELV